MTDLEAMQQKLDTLNTHVTGVDREKPGLLMRVDRLEHFVKLLVALASLGVSWKILEVFGSLIERAVAP